MAEKEDGICFYVNNQQMMAFHENGNILIKGKICTNDIELVDTFREFLQLAFCRGCKNLKEKCYCSEFNMYCSQCGKRYDSNTDLSW